MQLTGVKMTRHEFQVFTWLLSKASASRRVKCSARTLALKFNFSDAYAGRLLKRMVDDELLEILRKGTGQRANLYALENIDLSSVHLPRKKRKVSFPVAEVMVKEEPELGLIGRLVRSASSSPTHTRLMIPPTTSTVSHIEGRKESRINNNASAGTYAGATRLTILSQIPRAPIKPSRRIQSPMRAFVKKKNDPTEWNAKDMVCYYILLFKYEYGHEPAINWKTDLGAARNLLNQFEEYDIPPAAVKRYLQLSFALMKRSFTPTSLGQLTQSWVINQARGKWDHSELVEDYRDQDVLANVV